MSNFWKAVKSRWAGLIRGQNVELVLVAVHYVAPTSWDCPRCGAEYHPADVGWESVVPGAVGSMRCNIDDCECMFDVPMEEVTIGRE